ncbi:Phosphate acetyltransferase, partial [Phytophthora megakarya]
MWTLRRSLRRSALGLTQPRRALTAAAMSQGKVPIENLYVTSTEVTKKTAPVLIGLAHVLEHKFNKVGYFRPIQPSADSSMADHHVHVMKQELELSQSVEELYGVTSSRAMEAMLTGRGDDIVEEILERYEECRKGHDFMIIEGSQVSKHESAMSWKINVDIAKAIGSPVLLVSDFGEASAANGALLEEMVSRTVMGKDQADAAGLNYIGSIANRVRAQDVDALRADLKKTLGEKEIPFLGFLPMDDIVASKRLNEVVHQLGATQLFGNSIASDAVVTSAVVAASALKDLFAHLKKYKDGAMIITSGDRSDLMLGLMVSRLPGVLPNISAIVLTNGNYPHSNTQEILKGVEALDKTGLSLPIFSTPNDTFSTADGFAKVSTDILPSSQLKIDRSKELFDEFVEKEMLIGELDQGMVVNRSPKQFQHFLFSKARAVQRHIVLTEGEDIRVLQAADQILRQNLSKITIL